MKVVPQPGMRVKWRSIYFPIGEWVNDAGDVVDIVSSFRAKYGDKDILVVMQESMSPAGHGEPSMTAITPTFIDEKILDSLPATNDYIKIK